MPTRCKGRHPRVRSASTNLHKLSLNLALSTLGAGSARRILGPILDPTGEKAVLSGASLDRFGLRAGSCLRVHLQRLLGRAVAKRILCGLDVARPVDRIASKVSHFVEIRQLENLVQHLPPEELAELRRMVASGRRTISIPDRSFPSDLLVDRG